MRVALADQGYACAPDLLDSAALAELERLFDRLDPSRPGARIGPAACNDLAAMAVVRSQSDGLLGPEARVVRALLFDKRDGANWALGWHQDRTIEVVERIDLPGYGSWTSKQGRLHVAPPIALLERMLTFRIHLDPVPEDNAPLRVAPGSHRLGHIAEDAIDGVVARCGSALCLAGAGTLWFYSTPILHGSTRASPGRRRRVLQLDMSADDLPGGLRWAAQGRLSAPDGCPKSLAL